MDITQPAEEINTDKVKAENAKIAILRDNATILESEISRLKSLVASENYAVEQLVKQRVDLLTQIPNLEEQRNLIQTNIEDLNTKLATVSQSVADSEKRVTKNTEYIENAMTLLKEKEAVVATQSEAMAIAVSKFNEDKKALDARETALDAKIKAFKAIID